MVGDAPEETANSPDAGRAKRAPPTIDLRVSEVTSKTESPAEDAPAAPSPPPKSGRLSMAATVIAAITGAAVAALVLAGAMFVGWPAAPPAPPAPVAASSAAIDELATRLASLESGAGKPVAAADAAATGRVEALEQSVAALRGELDGLRAGSEKLATEVNDIKSAPRETLPPAPDLSGINERIAGLERAIRTQRAEVAQESAKPMDDVLLRRIVAAGLLDALVRTGDPYPTALAAAKSVAANADELKPLDQFAASGVPSPANLCRELLTLVPKLSPPAPAMATTGSGILDRLEAGAAQLVRIERTDTKGTDRDNVVARVTAAALRNDLNEARRELNTLPPADRGAALGWIEKADARDAALTSSREFAAAAMSALAKPAL